MNFPIPGGMTYEQWSEWKKTLPPPPRFTIKWVDPNEKVYSLNKSGSNKFTKPPFK